MLRQYGAAAALGVALLVSLDAHALTLGLQDGQFSCTLHWIPSGATFTGQCDASGKTFSVAGKPPYVDEHGAAEQDNAFAATAVQDGATAYRLRIRLLLTDRDNRSGAFGTRGQVISDVFFWNVKDCRNAPVDPPVDSSCWINSTPWHAQGEMRPDR